MNNSHRPTCVSITKEYYYSSELCLRRWYSIIRYLLNGSDALKVTVIELVESKGTLYSLI